MILPLSMTNSPDIAGFSRFSGLFQLRFTCVTAQVLLLTFTLSPIVIFHLNVQNSM